MPSNNFTALWKRPDITDKHLVALYLWYPQGGKYNKDKRIAKFKSILSRFKCKLTVIYIDNSAKDSVSRKISGNEYEISGDNDYREFSGWQKGIDFANSLNLRIDGYLFANDMFFHDSFTRLFSIDQSAFIRALKYDAIVGNLIPFPVFGKIMDESVDWYIRTHIFLAAKSAIEGLVPLVSIDSQKAKEIFIPCYHPLIPLFKEDAPVSPVVKKCIFKHVTSHWYNKKPYNEKNFEYLRDKSLAILNSLMFSVKAKRWGYSLMDSIIDRRPSELRSSVAKSEKFRGILLIIKAFCDKNKIRHV